MLIKLSTEAENDLDNIWDYSYETWGERQADVYARKLRERFIWLLENTKLGLNRDEVKKGYQSYFQGEHTIFYREIEGGIEIIGIPKQSEDFIDHLNID